MYMPVHGQSRSFKNMQGRPLSKQTTTMLASIEIVGCTPLAVHLLLRRTCNQTPHLQPTQHKTVCTTECALAAQQGSMCTGTSTPQCSTPACTAEGTIPGGTSTWQGPRFPPCSLTAAASGTCLNVSTVVLQQPNCTRASTYYTSCPNDGFEM
jgi:hypothetical protein